MKLNLDLQLNKKLRDKVNEIGNFAYNKEYSFPVDGKAVSAKNAYNCICAALDRIGDLSTYCNSIELTQDKDGVFALCNLLNYAQTLIDCITIIGKVYNVVYEAKHDRSSFSQYGFNGKGTDEKYFKYLRSLCSVHPLATNRYGGEYQGNELEWCPYISCGSSVANRMLAIGDKNLENADYIAVIYRNDYTFCKNLPIKLCEIFDYIEKRYNFINDVINGIDTYNKQRIEELKAQHIPTPDECSSYSDYLLNLDKELALRYSACSYMVKEWLAMLQTKFDDEYIQTKFDAYLKVLKDGIKNIHNRLQAMDLFDDDDLVAINLKEIKALNAYGYEREKIHYLYPSAEMEDGSFDNLDFINRPTENDDIKLALTFDLLDLARKDGKVSEELREICKCCDSEYGTNNSEWARMMLKIIEPIISKNMKIDYTLNDWHLYLQVQMLFYYYK